MLQPPVGMMYGNVRTKHALAKLGSALATGQQLL